MALSKRSQEGESIKIATARRLHTTIKPTRAFLFLIVLASALAGMIMRTVDIATIPEFFTDEGFWAMPPRDFVLFSRWTLGSYYHHYLSPLFSALLALEFSLIGPGIVQARLLSAIAGTLTILGVAWLGKRLGSPTAGTLAAIALAFDGPSIITSRSAILESLQCFLLVMIACQVVGEGRARRAFMGLLICLAVLTKLLSLHAVPAVVLYSWWKRGWREAILDAASLLAGLLLAGLVFGAIAVHDWDNFTLTWGWELTTRTVGRATMPAGEEGSLLSTARYFLSRSPIAGVAFLSILAWILAWRKFSSATLFLGLWIAFGVIVMSTQGYSPQRYYIPLIPFIWIWVFLTLREVKLSTSIGAWASRIASILVIAQVLFSVASFAGYYYILDHRNEDPVMLARWVDENVGPGQRVLGPFRLLVSTKAQGLGFESVAAPAQPTSADLDALGIDFVVTAPDTRLGPPLKNLWFVESDGEKYSLVAQFREIKVYRVAR